MEVITFSPDMDLSSKEAGDVFRLKLYGIEYDVKVVGDDEDPLMFCKDCIFFNNSERCSLSESQDRANIMFNYHLTHKWDQYYH